MDSDNAYQQHRAIVQLYLAGEEAEEHIQDNNRLYGVVFISSDSDSNLIRIIYFHGRSCGTDGRIHAVNSDNPFCDRPDALSADVNGIYIILCIHAEYESEGELCDCARDIGRSGDAGVATFLHTFPDMGKQLQRHIRIVCGIASLYVMDTNLVDDMPVRSGTVLYESKS